jgi:hypothetical protein
MYLSGANLIALLVLSFYFVFSVFSTADYFKWNRLRWDAIDTLITQMRIPKEKIDGGFEFNGLYFYDSSYRPTEGKSWWWVQDDEYRIGFGDAVGYVTIKEFPFDQWHTSIKSKITLLKKL